MQKKINIYQAFVRLFGNEKNTNIPYGTLEQNGCGKLNDFTSQALENIAKLGCNYIWYTGVIEHACKTPYHGAANASECLVKGEAGSPYAIIDYYQVHPDLASSPKKGMKEFEALVKRSHKAGLQVIIDFVPNHVAREYNTKNPEKQNLNLGLNDHPEYYFHPQNNFYYLPHTTFFPHIGITQEEFPYHEAPAKATGNDCYSPNPSIYDWYETIKINYGVDYGNGSTHFDPIPDTWTKMLDILLFWASKKVDGFRCDMAHMVPLEFWHWAITKVKAQYPNVIFIAELYDQNIYRPFIEYGRFDYLYDKMGFYDVVKNIIQNGASAHEITGIWQRNEGIQHRMLNFLENHDEVRLASFAFADYAPKGIPGMMLAAWMHKNASLIYFGQEIGENALASEGFSGMDGRTSIFDYWCLDKMLRYNNDGKWNEELLSTPEKELKDMYQRILNLSLNENTLSKGAFYDLMYANISHGGFDSHRVYTFLRKYDDELLVVAINFSGETKDCCIYIPEHAFGHLDVMPDHYAYEELITHTHGFAHLNHQTPFICSLPAFSGKAYKFTVNRQFV